MQVGGLSMLAEVDREGEAKLYLAADIIIKVPLSLNRLVCIFSTHSAFLCVQRPCKNMLMDWVVWEKI